MPTRTRERVPRRLRQQVRRATATTITSSSDDDANDAVDEDDHRAAIATTTVKTVRTETGKTTTTKTTDVTHYALRERRVVIRYRNYSPSDDVDSYMREQVLLYVPFRSEAVDFLGGNKYGTVRAAQGDDRAQAQGVQPGERRLGGERVGRATLGGSAAVARRRTGIPPTAPRTRRRRIRGRRRQDEEGGEKKPERSRRGRGLDSGGALASFGQGNRHAVRRG